VEIFKYSWIATGTAGHILIFMNSRSQWAAFLLVLISFSLWGCSKKSSTTTGSSSSADDFLRLMNSGKNYLEQGQTSNAIPIYQKAQALNPNDFDVHLNLANSYLLANDSENAIKEAEEGIKLDPNSPAPHFIKGSALLRLGKAEEAIKSFENAKNLDPAEAATWFQLGMARMQMKQWDEAIAAFTEAITLQPEHPAAHYNLSQALLRVNREDEAKKELETHQALVKPGAPPASAATFEKSKYTQARVPFKLEQPAKDGPKITFTDATKEAFGAEAQNFSGPIGVLDANHNGWNSLFVVEKGQGFRLLWNTNGTFHPYQEAYPFIPDAKYSKMLVADLQNDRYDDVIVLGDKGSHVFKFATNGFAMDVTPVSRLTSLNATDGTLVDLDFTGKLDLVAVTGTNDVRIYRQFGPLLFSDITRTSGIPAILKDAQSVLVEDWNKDETMDLIVSRKSGAPLLLEKQRGGPLAPKEITNWVSGAVFATGDFDNDLRSDIAIATGGKIVVSLNGSSEPKEIPIPPNEKIQQIATVDYDSDGWLDLWTVGDRIHVFRNLGISGFEDVTAKLGLDKFDGGPISEIHFADFDMDCDSDAVVALANGGLRYLRNDGGSANHQIKVQLFGNRSNASGIGCKIEIETGALRLSRTVQTLPVEIGVGKYDKLDSFLVHWFNLPQGFADTPVDCKNPLAAFEITLPEGSCPYLYAWDGERFRFVTDILGASPLGLPVAEGHLIDADPTEFVWIGTEKDFPARNGNYEIQITEELREVLYLDEAKLVVVDHPPETQVHPTDKLLPGKPFPEGTLMTLRNEHSLVKAETLEGRDVTELLQKIDGRRVSPQLRIPQLRGLAEPHGVLLDFGSIETNAPLVLALNGWLRFGGGMANVAASEDPSLPLPFPKLEAEVAPGIWQHVDVVVGAPAGKTKTILVDLEGKLPPNTHRLRLTEAFEIHWDKIALMEKVSDANTKISFISPTRSDLHYRGFSEFKELPFDWPLTPDYNKVTPNSRWRITPGGWCTRYGEVGELIAQRDEGLVLLNGGDELTLQFAANALPPKPTGAVREFFLYSDGWDKDSDFHCVAGTTVEPLPFHGMDDQRYTQQKRPTFPSDALHQKYNTRWVDGQALRRVAKK
jgi:Flp pilus assembly protein TadD